MRNLFEITSALLVILLLVLCSKNDPDINLAELRSEIERMNVEFEAAFVNGDIEALMTLYTEDVILRPADLPDVKGWEAAKTFSDNVFKILTVIKYELKIEEFEIYNDTVYDRGTFTWISQQEGQPDINARGWYIAVRKKGTDNKWRFHRLIENVLPSEN